MPRSTLRYLLFAGFAWLIQPPLLPAQQPDTARLKELVVTATRTPTPWPAVGSSVDRLGAAELRAHQITTLREALQLVPGGPVLVTGAPAGITSLFLRGVASSQTLFLIDGVRVNDADASYGSLLAGLELSGFDRLEIVRGPQSTLYGGAAIGGVIALDALTRAGHPRGEAQLEGGSFATWRGRVSGEGGSGRFGAAAALSANGTDNQRRPNDWDQRTQLARIEYASAQLRAGASFRGVQHEYTSPGDIRATNTTPEGTTKFEHELATLWIEAAPLRDWHSKLLGGAVEQFSQGTGRFNGGPEFVFTLRNTRRVLDWQNTFEPGHGVELLAGVNREWSTAKSDSDTLEQRLWGVYAEARVAPVPALHLTAGARSDDYNSFGRAMTYRFTGAWLVGGSGLKLRGSLGSGFMPPSLAARFGSVFQNPNPEIRPERSRGWDVGAEHSLLGGRATLSASWFHNSLRDLIGFAGAAFPEKGRAVNIDRARTQGLELSGRIASSRIGARVAYTLLSARSVSEPDPSLRRLIRRPRHTASGDLAVQLTQRGSAGTGFVAVLDREDVDFNSFPSRRVDPGDYLNARLYGAYQIGAFQLELRVENLLDARYEPVYGFPALGRSVTGSVAWRF